MAIMRYDEWMRRTKMGVLKPRSKHIKFLDAAVREYDKHRGASAYLETLRAAFIAWANAKGDAESSERNRGGAVTDLMNQLIDFDNDHRPAKHLRPAGLLRDIRSGAKLMSEGKLKPQIKVKLSLGEVDNSKGKVIYEEFDNPQLVKAKKGWADAFRCAELAAAGIRQVGRQEDETERFRKWFGDPQPPRIAVVAAALDKMLAAFRENQVTIVNREDIMLHLVNGNDPFGATTDGFTGDDVYGYVFQHAAGSGYRVIMGKHFLADPDPIEGAAQTVYHELTHKVLKTVDHVYGKVKCRGLATMQAAKALENADNFGFYAVSFIKPI